MTSASPAPRGVYLITPDEPDTARLLARTAPLLAAGATWLQYRNKSASDALRREQATALQALCAAHGVPLIVNDDPELAQAIGAAGVHLGGTDGDIGAARSLLGPDAIIGASCYDQLANAEHAVAAGASYVAFGAFFPTTTKVTSSRAHPDLLRQSAALGVPRVAIGGLSPDNVGPIIDAGADLLAVVSGIYAAQDPVATQRAYLARFDTQQ
ncbi:thiamine phosphate synthase [Stenotrophomonas indicatrix]|uniref:thiamine phosphate synthase n=2 Tax=Stenotrophomonas indicatrix TaxID=2045451 RepID=UPI0028E8E9FD|nr:thiamine phosphate synthase [Stenotrophomonas indicatrix]MDT9582554.1 thiamine phosphate synthase [Stenotrophomonas indicatrix]